MVLAGTESSGGRIDLFFLAVTNEIVDELDMFPLYFVNSSSRPVEDMVVFTPRGARDLKPWVTIADINDSMVDGYGTTRHRQITAGSHLRLLNFFPWEFNWPTERLIFLKAESEEIHLHFRIGKNLIALESQVYIPALHRPGWIISGEEHGFRLKSQSNSLSS